MVENLARKRRWISLGSNGLPNPGLIQRSGFESEMELLKGLGDRLARAEEQNQEGKPSTSRKYNR
jgi:hypothetical protein